MTNNAIQTPRCVRWARLNVTIVTEFAVHPKGSVMEVGNERGRPGAGIAWTLWNLEPSSDGTHHGISRVFANELEFLPGDHPPIQPTRARASSRMS